MAAKDHFLMSDGLLHDEKGHLIEKGYQTYLSRTYDRSRIKAAKFRIKEWDYYCINSGDTVLALTIADNGYMGLDSISLLHFGADNHNMSYTNSPMRLFPMGKTGLPATSLKGDVAVEGKGYSISFRNDGETRVLDARMDNFYQGKKLEAHVVLTGVPEDSMVIVTPFKEDPKAFYYNQKINCLLAEGYVTFGEETFTFQKEDSMAVLDWGRGVWTYKNTWYWSSLSGRIDGVPFGFNLGYGFGDTSAASENMLFLDGKAYKLDRVTFEIPKTADGKDDFYGQWKIEDNLGELDLTFTPILDRASLTSVLVIESDQHQVFGRFSGTARFDGRELKLNNLLGFAEKVANKW